MVLPYQIRRSHPSRAMCLPSKQQQQVMRGSQVSVVEEGGMEGGVEGGEGWSEGLSFVKKSRNSCGWQMKSVHSSEAAPYRRPVEQSQELNERQDNGGAQH